MILFMHNFEHTNISENKKLLSDLINAAKIQKDPRITSLFTVWENCDFVGGNLSIFLEKNESYLKKIGVKNWLLSRESTQEEVEFFWDLGENTRDTIFWHGWETISQNKYDFFYTLSHNNRESVMEILGGMQEILLSILSKEQMEQHDTDQK